MRDPFFVQIPAQFFAPPSLALSHRTWMLLHAHIRPKCNARLSFSAVVGGEPAVELGVV
jgi:hypothetical protein